MNVCMIVPPSASVLQALLQAVRTTIFSRTKSELGPLQLALLAMVGGLVLGSGRSSVSGGLLQDGVGAHRGRDIGVVEEGDDILLRGLIH